MPIFFKFLQSVMKWNAMPASKLDERFHWRAGQLRCASERDFVFAEEEKSDDAGSFGGKTLLVEFGDLDQFKRQLKRNGLHSTNLTSIASGCNPGPWRPGCGH